MATRFWKIGAFGLALAAMVLGTAAHADDRAAIGGRLTANGNVDGDISFIGGSIEIDADVSGEVSAVGGEIDIEGSVGGDLSAVGGDITVNARVGGELSMAGGSLTIGDNSHIQGDANLAGGSIHLGGTYDRDVHVAGGDVDFRGVIKGNVEAYGGEFTFRPGAKIVGNLTIKGPEEPDVPAGFVEGDYTYEYRSRWFRHWDSGAFVWSFGDFKFAGAVILTVWALLSGIVLIMLFPRFTGHASFAQREGVLSSIGLGFLLLIIVPLAAVFMMVTILALPVGIFAFIVYPFLLWFGYVAGVMGVSRLALGAEDPFPPRSTQILWFTGALVITSACLLIPVAGFAVLLILSLAGMGGIAIALFSGRPETAAQADGA